MSKKSKNKKPVVVPNPYGFTEEEMFGIYKVNASPFYWRQKAEEMKRAADILRPKAEERTEKMLALIEKEDFDISELEPDLFPTTLGLLGYCLECLFKACLIRDDHNLINDGVQDSKMQTHDLIKLAQMANIVLDNDEKRVCKELTKVIYGNFRYPVNKEATIDKSTTEIGRNIFDVVNDLYNKIHPTVKQIHTADGKAIVFKSANANSSESESK